jgi:hypothetical protein
MHLFDAGGLIKKYDTPEQSIPFLTICWAKDWKDHCRENVGLGVACYLMSLSLWDGMSTRCHCSMFCGGTWPHLHSSWGVLHLAPGALCQEKGDNPHLLVLSLQSFDAISLFKLMLMSTTLPHRFLLHIFVAHAIFF